MHQRIGLSRNELIGTRALQKAPGMSNASQVESPPCDVKLCFEEREGDLIDITPAKASSCYYPPSLSMQY
jgi:hypothetical protein